MRSQESLTHKMKKAIYPGSFDPMTLGHLDIIERSSRIVDELNVAVLKNNAKNPLFSADERVSMIKEFTSHLPNVTVTHMMDFWQIMQIRSEQILLCVGYVR